MPNDFYVNGSILMGVVTIPYLHIDHIAFSKAAICIRFLNRRKKQRKKIFLTFILDAVVGHSINLTQDVRNNRQIMFRQRKKVIVLFFVHFNSINNVHCMCAMYSRMHNCIVSIDF